MTIKERLILFIKSQKFGQAAFEKKAGLSNGYVNNIRQSIQPNKLAKIASTYPELNTGWLMTGEGSMLKELEADIEKVKQSVIQAEALLPLVKANIIDVGLANFFRNDYLLGYCKFEPVTDFIASLPKRTLLKIINNHPHYKRSERPAFNTQDNVEDLQGRVLKLIYYFGNDYLIENTGKYAKKYQEIIFAYDFDFLKKLQASNLITPLIDAGLRTIHYPNFLVGEIKNILQREWHQIEIKDSVDTMMASLFDPKQKKQ